MPELSKLLDELKTARDEIKLKIHLGGKDAKDQWEAAEARWEAFQVKAQLSQSAADVGDAVEILGSELKEAYQRVRKAL